jgi:hypothetical protein
MADPLVCPAFPRQPSVDQMGTFSFFVHNQTVAHEIGQLTYNEGDGETATIDGPDAWFWTQTA